MTMIPKFAYVQDTRNALLRTAIDFFVKAISDVLRTSKHITDDVICIEINIPENLRGQGLEFRKSVIDGITKKFVAEGWKPHIEFISPSNYDPFLRFVQQFA